MLLYGIGPTKAAAAPVSLVNLYRLMYSLKCFAIFRHQRRQSIQEYRSIQAAECKENELDSSDWRGYDHPGTWQQRQLFYGDKVS